MAAPEAKQRHLAAARLAQGNLSPEMREKRRQQMLALWADPAWRMRMTGHGRSPSFVRHVPALRERDGDECRLCCELIDFTVPHPDPLSRSVDHIVPRAHGGKDELDNYQLAHLICNQRKGSRVPGGERIHSSSGNHGGNGPHRG